MHKTILGVALLCATFAGGVFAADEQCGCDHGHSHVKWNPSFYAGASLSQSTFERWGSLDFNDGSYTSSAGDEDGTGYRAFTGVDFLGYVALEVGYADFGQARFNAQSDGSGSLWSAGPISSQFELRGFDLRLAGKLPIYRGLKLVAQTGLLVWQRESSASGDVQGSGAFAYQDSARGEDILFGGGLEYDGWQSLRLGATYQFVQPGEGFRDPDIKTLAIALGYRFQP
jgi:hypothetical protein